MQTMAEIARLPRLFFFSSDLQVSGLKIVCCIFIIL
jgi:hypothetical protein